MTPVRFGELSSGTNDVPSIEMDRVSKPLTVAIKNGKIDAFLDFAAKRLVALPVLSEAGGASA